VGFPVFGIKQNNFIYVAVAFSNRFETHITIAVHCNFMF